MAEYYEVEEILGSRIVQGQRQFLVRWLGFNETEDTWEPEESLREDCKELLENYLSRHSPKPNKFVEERLSVTPIKQHQVLENGHTPKETPKVNDSLEKEIERLTSADSKKMISFSERYFFWQFLKETSCLSVLFFGSILLVAFLLPYLQSFQETITS